MRQEPIFGRMRSVSVPLEKSRAASRMLLIYRTEAIGRAQRSPRRYTSLVRCNVTDVGKRRIIIGAIGGDRQKESAMALGKAVVEAGCILLTGGKIQDSDEVKDAAMLGAASAEAGGSVARLVGILPSENIVWDESIIHRLFLQTGRPHNIRNVINGLTPDVLVVFGGSMGTLAEAAFALAARKPLFFCGLPTCAVIGRLLRNFRDCFSDRDGANNEDVDIFLRDPVNAFPNAWNDPPSVAELKEGLANLLTNASNSAVSQTELVASCIAAATNLGPTGQTGFPGLPGDSTAKARFEANIERISI
jgi:uncharacterized protein (TIGR00725 family)